MNKEKLKICLRLFWDFFKFGCFTFGGGWSIIAQMQKLYVEEKQEITSEELLDITSVGRSLPGTMIGNVAVLYGYHFAGIPGGIVCVFGIVMPPLLVLILITFFYSIIQDNVIVIAAMKGVRAAVVPIIASAAFKMVKGSFKYPPCYVIFAAAIALNLFLKVSCLLLVVIGIICGLLLCRFYGKREVNHDLS